MVSSARARVLVASIILLATSAVGSVLVVRAVLHVRLDERIDRELVQEGDEFRQLLGGTDPRTGEPFGSDAEAIFEVFLSRNVPGEDEILLTLLGDRPFLRSANAPFPVEELPELMGTWGGVAEPTLATYATPAGSVRALALPVMAGAERLGTFVVARYPAGERAEVDDAVRVAALVAALALAVASIVSWSLAGRVLAPLHDLAAAATAIGEDDMGRRIDVRGSGEIADLTRTFNAMLDRVELLTLTQRQFLDDAGHELRTPLTVIRGNLELLEGGQPLAPASRSLLLDEVDRMARIVDDLLTLAAAQQPDFLRLERLDVDDLLRDALDRARSFADRDWVLGHVDPGAMTADRQRLLQALLNLLRNAAQHTPDGGRITVTGSAGEGTIHLEVHDDGEGIPDDVQAHIFERFARGPSGHRPRGDGAGLGLAITAAIVEAHGGRISVASQLGGGTTFLIDLPDHHEPSS